MDTLPNNLAILDILLHHKDTHQLLDIPMMDTLLNPSLDIHHNLPVDTLPNHLVDIHRNHLVDTLRSHTVDTLNNNPMGTLRTLHLHKCPLGTHLNPPMDI